MSGIGPVEPGEGTYARDALDGAGVPNGAPTQGAPAQEGSPTSPPGPFVRRCRRHRRAVLAAAAAAALLAGSGYLYATRPRPAPPPPPPYPSQAVDLDYAGSAPVPRGTPPRTFAFTLWLRVQAGPPVTVTRFAQPYPGLSVTSAPATPFRAVRDAPLKITITMRVTECGKVPRNVGLPFLDVTLRNARAIEDHSYILGRRYAEHLSTALHVACGNESE